LLQVDAVDEVPEGPPHRGLAQVQGLRSLSDRSGCHRAERLQLVVGQGESLQGIDKTVGSGVEVDVLALALGRDRVSLWVLFFPLGWWRSARKGAGTRSAGSGAATADPGPPRPP
jgi:hypothetical protein